MVTLAEASLLSCSAAPVVLIVLSLETGPITPYRSFYGDATDASISLTEVYESILSL